MDSRSIENRNRIQILRLRQVCEITGIGRSLIYQLEAMRQFPVRVRIGSRAVGWVESEVQLWLAGRLEHHRASDSCGASAPEHRAINEAHITHGAPAR